MKTELIKKCEDAFGSITKSLAEKYGIRIENFEVQNPDDMWYRRDRCEWTIGYMLREFKDILTDKPQSADDPMTKEERIEYNLKEALKHAEELDRYLMTKTEYMAESQKYLGQLVPERYLGENQDERVKSMLDEVKSFFDNAEGLGRKKFDKAYHKLYNRTKKLLKELEDEPRRRTLFSISDTPRPTTEAKKVENEENPTNEVEKPAEKPTEGISVRKETFEVVAKYTSKDLDNVSSDYNGKSYYKVTLDDEGELVKEPIKAYQDEDAIMSVAHLCKDDVVCMEENRPKGDRRYYLVEEVTEDHLTVINYIDGRRVTPRRAMVYIQNRTA